MFSREKKLDNKIKQGFACMNKKCRFCSNNEIDTLISKRLYVENKAKLSELTRANLVAITKVTQ